jgi:hypothetical protein
MNGEPEVEVHIAGGRVSWNVRVGATVHRLDTLGELLTHVRMGTPRQVIASDVTSK